MTVNENKNSTKKQTTNALLTFYANMVAVRSVCFMVLKFRIYIDLLPCAHCQLPNIYDLTWFESFSLQNYDEFLTTQDDTKFNPKSDSQSFFSQSDIDTFLAGDFRSSLDKTSNKFTRTTADSNVESADVLSEDGGHFDSRFVQQSDRYG